MKRLPCDWCGHDTQTRDGEDNPCCLWCRDGKQRPREPRTGLCQGGCGRLTMRRNAGGARECRPCAGLPTSGSVVSPDSRWAAWGGVKKAAEVAGIHWRTLLQRVGAGMTPARAVALGSSRSRDRSRDGLAWIGRVIGVTTVLAVDTSATEGAIMMRVRCECGRERSVALSRLRHGQPRSCRSRTCMARANAASPWLKRTTEAA